ncbi:MAG: hypothetical protein ABI333_30150 [bacterium]
MRHRVLATICLLMVPTAFSSSWGYAAASEGSMARQPGRSGAAKVATRAPSGQSNLVQACGTPTQVTPSVGGKYQLLARRVHVPADCASYGAFNDYGYYPATSYGGQHNIPAGYWVYHYPYWYVYQQQRTAAQAPFAPQARCQPPQGSSPSVGGKYSGLIRSIRVSADCQSYGAFSDYGHYPATSYAGHFHLPSAYWVYHYPNWYLWRNQRP